jgi:hypothetical protein
MEMKRHCTHAAGSTFLRVCAGYEIVTKPARVLSPASCVWSECEIDTCTNDFVGLGNLMQMSRLTTGVHQKQAAVFKPEIHCFAISRFDLKLAT